MSRLIFEDNAGDQFWVEYREGKLTLFRREEYETKPEVIVDGDDILALVNFVLSELQERQREPDV